MTGADAKRPGKPLTDDPLGPSVPVAVTRIRADKVETDSQQVATEVPLTLRAGETEIATMSCSPTHLRELVYGFLYASGFIQGAADVLSCTIDTSRWVAELTLTDPPDPDRLGRRIYTPGCGKGVTYADVIETASRLPLRSDMRVPAADIRALAAWLQRASETYRETRGLHTAGLSEGGALPELAIDDIGRHNAVDKVIGHRLLSGGTFERAVLVSSGRISSEILHKARRAGIPILVARGGPTHQSVLRARDLGLTIVGFARAGGFSVFSHPERIVVEA